jgi:hypothetical protein
MYNGQALLALDPKPTPDKLEPLAGLAGGFEQPWAQLSMDGECRSDNLFGNVVQSPLRALGVLCGDP